MRLHKISIKNFRLLKDVDLFLEPKTTVVVGRNNSGKTSLTELFRRLLGYSKRSTFRLEDFSLSVHKDFWAAFILRCNGSEEEEVRAALPVIEIGLTISYDSDAADFGQLSEFIIDLNPDCTEALVQIRYELKDGGLDVLFEGLQCEDMDSQRKVFFKSLNDRVRKSYDSNVKAVDPNDPSNKKSIEWSQLHSLVQSGFIYAQRGMDDTTDKDIDFLGAILERLLISAMSDLADPKDQETAQSLQKAVDEMQEGLDSGFNKQLKDLFPAFSLFGYPGLSDPRLLTQTTLDIQRLLKNHTKVQYEGVDGVNFPETYNGLGIRNLIFILLKLLEFFKDFRTTQPAPGICLVFIEEPEVHLHPQMQEVFIAKLGEIAALLSAQLNDGSAWPVQFVVTTHSSHLANRAEFDSIRYFKAASDEAGHGFVTRVKDLRNGLSDTPEAAREFLHKYMTLTRCDLLFADKAALIEGTSERLLLPVMIQKIDAENDSASKLSRQYLSIVEVGGAYAHLFFDLVEFLELPTLIVTDLDSIDAASQRSACKVSVGSHTSNACINSWFGNPVITLSSIRAKEETEKMKGTCRLAFQVPEAEDSCCGRSLEGAFMLANPTLFGLDALSEDDKETEVWNKTNQIGLTKTAFALKYAIENTDWNVPRYVADGLRWLRDVGTEQGGTTQVQAVHGQPGDSTASLAPLHGPEEAGVPNSTASPDGDSNA
jgi:predicted ATP-dependent endonuclease of OLD family